jgi:hypothetical protein
MPTPFAEDHSYAAVVNMRPTHPQELASEQATQTPGVMLDITPPSGHDRKTPYDQGLESVTPSETQQHASRTAVSGGDGGQSPKHPSRPGDTRARFDTLPRALG